MNDSWLTSRFLLGASLRDWLIAIIAVAAVAAVLYVGRRVLLRRLERFAPRTRTGADDAIAHLLRRTSVFLAIFAASRIMVETLTLAARVESLIQAVGTIALFVQLGLWVSAAIGFWTDRVISHRAHLAQSSSAGTLRAIAFALRLLLWSVLLLVALDTFDIDVTALIAGLGLGGIAVALAVQNILGDLLAALAIVLDKPFVVGDAIQVDNFSGTVQHVGIKTTRVRAMGGEELIFPNANLLQSRIQNFRRMVERRVALVIGVRYETPRARLAEIADLLRDIVQRQEQVRFERAHLDGFGDSAISFELVYHVLTADYLIHMNIKQAIALEILREFEAREIDFAYPTRRLFVHREEGATDGVLGAHTPSARAT
jgi:small-conductance mechanosensitive channel